MLLLTQIQVGDNIQPNALNRTDAEAFVDSLAGEYVKLKCRVSPHWATSLGIEGYDGRLARFTLRDVKGPLKRCLRLTRKLQSFEVDSLSISGWVDWEMLLADIGTHEFWFGEQEMHKRSPLVYTDAIAEGMIWLLLGERDDSLSYHLASRMRGVPDVITHARANLSQPIGLHCRVASSDLDLLDLLLVNMSQLSHPAIDRGIVTDSLLTATRDALASFKHFVDSLSTSGSDQYALGTEQYSEFLRRRHSIEEPLDQVVAYAREVLGQAGKKLDELDSSRERRTQQPAPGADRLELYRRRMRAVLGGLEAADRLRIEAGDSLIAVEGLGYLDPILKGAVYVAPGIASEDGRGAVYLVNPQDLPVAVSGSSPWRQWRSVPIYYPAQHLLESRSRGRASFIRRHFRNELGRDGWALYFRQISLPGAAGNDDGREEEIKLWQEVQFRAASCIAEVRLHTGEFTVEEAAGFIAENSARDSGAALADARRYAVAPGSGIGYVIGRREILRLRERYHSVKRKSFDLKEFHDTLLSCGYLPPYLLSVEVMSKGMGRE